jgi:hypothetical protein
VAVQPKAQRSEHDAGHHDQQAAELLGHATRSRLLAAAASSAFETPTCEIFTPSAFMASGHVEPVRQIRRVDQRSTIPQHKTEFMSRRSRHHRVPVIVRRALVIGAVQKPKDSIYEPQDHFLDDSRCDGGHRR